MSLGEMFTAIGQEFKLFIFSGDGPFQSVISGANLVRFQQTTFYLD